MIIELRKCKVLCLTDIMAFTVLVVVQKKWGSTKGLTQLSCLMFSCSCFICFCVFLVFFPSSSLGLLSPVSVYLAFYHPPTPTPPISAPPPPSVVETVQSNAQLLLDSGPPLFLRCQETISETCIPVPVLNWQEGSLKATPATMECV